MWKSFRTILHSGKSGWQNTFQCDSIFCKIHVYVCMYICAHMCVCVHINNHNEECNQNVKGSYPWVEGLWKIFFLFSVFSDLSTMGT